MAVRSRAAKLILLHLSTGKDMPDAKLSLAIKLLNGVFPSRPPRGDRGEDVPAELEGRGESRSRRAAYFVGNAAGLSDSLRR